MAELSIVEYARRHSVSDMTVRRRIKTGKLKAILKEGKYYIPDYVTSSQQRTVQAHTPKHAPPPNQPIPTMTREYDIPREELSAPVPQQRGYSRDHDRPRQSQPHPQVQPQPQVQRDFVSQNELKQIRQMTEAIKLSLQEVRNKEEQIAIYLRDKIEKLERDNIQLNRDVDQKEHTIQQLQRQLEDLQVLVKMLEESA